MPPKAILAQNSVPYWIDVAAKLRDSYGWEICYLIGGKKHAAKAANLFPDCVYHLKQDARKGIAAQGCSSVQSAPLDDALLSELAFNESIFMKMMDRYDFGGTFTYHKRIFAYHSQVMYWKGVLEHFKPEVVVYRIAPHGGYDYILYALSRMLNIRTVMFERSSLPGYVYPVASFEDGSEMIASAYARALEMGTEQEASLTPETAAYIENLSKSYDRAMPFHLKYKMKQFRRSGEIGGVLPILLGAARGLIKGFLKKRGQAEYQYEQYHRNRGRFQRKRLLAHYNRLAKPVDLTVPYIFVALQCEPERQTCPIGGVFGNQYLMIDLLSKLVPDGWKIYVKEHVSQFKEYQAAERAKTLEFYNVIVSMPNVELVPLTWTSFEMIDHARASATVSGTVGWESVVRGKPALLFGHSWYRDCKGVFVTHTVEDCRAAIQQIQKGFQVSVKDVNCFAHVMERCAVKGYVDKLYARMNIISPAENVENIAKAIHEFIA